VEGRSDQIRSLSYRSPLSSAIKTHLSIFLRANACNENEIDGKKTKEKTAVNAIRLKE
jgi:hypothetical protein